MRTVNRILLLEHPDQSSPAIIDEICANWPGSTVLKVQDAGEMRRALSDGIWDLLVIGAPYDLLDVAETIKALQEARSDLPVILLSTAGRVIERQGGSDATTRQALKLSEMRYKILADNIADVIWMGDFHMKVTYVSPSVYKLRGYTVEETLKQSPREILAEQSYETAREMFDLNMPGGKPDPVKTKEPRVYELYLTRKNAPPVPTETAVTVIYDDEGKPLGTLSVSRDITERKKMENELRLREERLRKAQEIAHIGDWEWDSGTNRITCSEEVVRMFGFSEEEASRPDAFLRALHPDDRHAFLSSVKEAASKNEAFSMDYRIVRPDGEERIIHNQGRGFSDESGEPTKVLGTVQDITDLKLAEAELRRLSRRLLEAQEDERRRIASMLQEEAGQSLTVLAMLLKQVGQTPLREDAARILEESKAVINELMRDLRRFSLSLRPTMLDDLGLFPTLEWYFRDFTERTKVRIKFEQEGADNAVPPEVNVAAYRIIQEALTNVAQHAGVEESRVRVEIGRASLLLEVEDEGRGFDPQKVGDRSAGLRNISERARELGGTSSIRSAPGSGTRLVVSLPFRNKSARRRHSVQLSASEPH